MLNEHEGKTAVSLARTIITSYVSEQPSTFPELTDSFTQKQGTFVTLHTYPNHELRGCIGIPLPVMPLKEAIIDAAQSSTKDPRFHLYLS